MLHKKSFIIVIVFVLLSKFTLAGGSIVNIGTSQNDTICYGTTLFLHASSAPYGYNDFTWSFSSTVSCYPSAQSIDIEVTFPSPGQYQIWCLVYDGGMPDGYTTKIFTVLPLPSVSLTTPFDSICNSSDAIILTGESPIGGIYSGAGITGNIFDPSFASYDSSYIYYEYADAFGCSSSDSTVVYIIKDCDTIQSINTISVYPNPTNGELNFLGIADDLNSEVWITDISGKEKMHFNLNNQKSAFLDFSSGVYIYRVKDKNGGIITGKIMLTK